MQAKGHEFGTERGWEPAESSRARLVWIFLLLLPIALSSVARAGGEGPPDGRSYLLRATVFGIAGNRGAVGEYRTAGTLGQATPIGTAGASGFNLYAGFWRSLLVPTSDVKSPLAQTFRNQLFGSLPNPSRPGTAIRYSLADQGPVSLEVLDVTGRKVRTLMRRTLPAGLHEVRWDGCSERGAALPSGVYFYRLSAGSFSAVERLMLLR